MSARHAGKEAPRFSRQHDLRLGLLRNARRERTNSAGGKIQGGQFVGRKRTIEGGDLVNIIYARTNIKRLAAAVTLAQQRLAHDKLVERRHVPDTGRDDRPAGSPYRRRDDLVRALAS